jgi:hypothetical protein
LHTKTPQRWRKRVAALIGDGGALGESQGLVDAAGDFVYVGARLALLLHEHFPQWDGTHVPERLTGALSGAQARLKLGGQRLTVERRGEKSGCGIIGKLAEARSRWRPGRSPCWSRTGILGR